MSNNQIKPLPIEKPKKQQFAFLERLWDGTKTTVKSMFGWLLGKVILLGQFDIFINAKSFQGNLKKFRKKWSEQPITISDEYRVKTEDGASLSTIKIQRNDQSKQPCDQVYIIFFNGNCTAYERNLFTMANHAQKLKANAIGFNYRNVSSSTGTVRSKDDLVRDGIAQVQHLLNQKVKPENIFLHGYSLGGAIATLVAARFCKDNKTVNLYNDRSFSTMANVIEGWLRTMGTNTGYKESLIGKFLGRMIKPMVSWLLKLANWEIDAAKAYEDIPEKNKQYMYVAANESKGDCIITQHGSLARKILNGGTEKNKARQMLVNKENKATQKIETNYDGHLVNEKDLVNNYKQNASIFFREFVKAATNNNANSTQ